MNWQTLLNNPKSQCYSTLSTCPCTISCANADNPHHHSMYLYLIYGPRFNILQTAYYHPISWKFPKKTPNLKFGESPLLSCPWLFAQQTTPELFFYVGPLSSRRNSRMRCPCGERNTIRAQLDSKSRIDPRSIKDQMFSYCKFCFILLRCNKTRTINTRTARCSHTLHFTFSK
jgi:hypothetical protein